jgi:hypothetical protein
LPKGNLRTIGRDDRVPSRRVFWTRGPSTGVGQNVECGKSNMKVYVFVVQIVVLDKLDYCATLNNLSAVADSPNFKVRTPCKQFS